MVWKVGGIERDVGLDMWLMDPGCSSSAVGEHNSQAKPDLSSAQSGLFRAGRSPPLQSSSHSLGSIHHRPSRPR